MKPGSGKAARVEALCFDMDGVLIESRTVIERAWSRSAAHNGVTMTPETIRDRIPGRPGSRAMALLFGRPTHDRQRTIAAEVDARETADGDRVPGVPDLLAKLKRAGVATIDLAPCPQDAATLRLAVGATVVVPPAAAPGATTS